MKQFLFSECIPNFLLYECFAMHMMTCQVLVLGPNTRGVTKISFLISQKSDKINSRRKKIWGGGRYSENGNLEIYLRDVVDGRHCGQKLVWIWRGLLGRWLVGTDDLLGFGASTMTASAVGSWLKKEGEIKQAR